jgi:hypothetical protein
MQGKQCFARSFKVCVKRSPLKKLRINQKNSLPNRRLIKIMVLITGVYLNVTLKRIWGVDEVKEVELCCFLILEKLPLQFYHRSQDYSCPF